MEVEKRPEPSSRKSLSGADFAGVGIQFAVAILVFLFAGQWLDKRLGTNGLFTIAGVFVGGGAAFYNMYRKITAAQRRDDEERKCWSARREAVTNTRALSFFAGVSAALIIVATIILRLYFRTVEQHHAMLVSAGLAFAVQLGSFALLRPARPGKGAPGELMIRWAIGAVLRFFVLLLYAPIARVFFLSLEAALVSLVTFFFLTMMAEPLLLAYDR